MQLNMICMEELSDNPDKMIQRLENPLVQMALLLASAIIVHLLLFIFMLNADGHHYHWVVSAVFLLMYAFFTSIHVLKTDRMNWLLRTGIYGFIGMLLGTYVLALAFSDNSVDIRSMKWIYFVVSFSFIIFLTIAFSMRKFMEYAQREDNLPPK